MEMEMEFLRKLPTPQELKEQFPVSTEVVAVKAQRDEEIRNIFEGKDDRLILVIGPCSADNEDAVLDYLTRLRNVQEKIADKVLIVPRVYTNKPRTTGEGYKGMVHQPDPEKQPNLLAGLVAIRKMHIHAIRTSGMTCADEMLYPENYRYLSDLLSYVAVAASSYRQWHGSSCRYEKSNQRRSCSHAQFRCSSSGRTSFYLQKLGSRNNR